MQEIWYVMTSRHQVIFRSPTYEQALKFAIRKVEIRQFKNLYVIKREDYDNEKWGEAEHIHGVHQKGR